MSLPVYENILITGISHSHCETIAGLVCNGHGIMGMHSHEESEEIRVESGLITCMVTGRHYRPGDTWSIPAGEMHGAYFLDTVAILKYHPPLPNGVERPVNLDAMGDIFTTP
jgi:quercetin dioxygenase-like cupin family protein